MKEPAPAIRRELERIAKPDLDRKTIEYYVSLLTRYWATRYNHGEEGLDDLLKVRLKPSLHAGNSNFRIRALTVLTAYAYRAVSGRKAGPCSYLNSDGERVAAGFQRVLSTIFISLGVRGSAEHYARFLRKRARAIETSGWLPPSKRPQPTTEQR
jgi:hypothetical protein